MVSIFKWLIPAPQQQLTLASAQLLEELEVCLSQEKLQHIVSTWVRAIVLKSHARSLLAVFVKCMQ
jgi:hypothetical protein